MKIFVNRSNVHHLASISKRRSKIHLHKRTNNVRLNWNLRRSMNVELGRNVRLVVSKKNFLFETVAKESANSQASKVFRHEGKHFLDVFDSDSTNVDPTKENLEFLFVRRFVFTSNDDDRRTFTALGKSSKRSSSSENNFRRICETFSDELFVITGTNSSGSLVFDAKLWISESRSAAGGRDKRVWHATEKNNFPLEYFRLHKTERTRKNNHSKTSLC